MDDDTEVAQRVARRAMSLIRAGADAEAAGRSCWAPLPDSPAWVELARARCAARVRMCRARSDVAPASE